MPKVRVHSFAISVDGYAAGPNQYLRAGLIDDLQIAIVPISLGAGERLFDNLDVGVDGYECVEFVSSPSAAHVRFGLRAI
jgi:RibD C-terminal domain